MEELQCLHDMLNQHIWVHVHAVKAMKHDSFDMFITIAAGLKFNQSAT